jgi:ribosome modulation factor
MKAKQIALTLVAGVFALGCGAQSALGQGPPPPPYGYQGYGYQGHEAWEDSHSGDQIGRRGFHDGIEGARKDYENHRRPDVNNRDEFRHPDDVPKHDRHEYREAFQQGYQEGVEHFYGGGPRRY